MIQRLIKNLLKKSLPLFVLTFAAGCSSQAPSANQAPEKYSIQQVKCAFYLKGEEKTIDTYFDRKKGQIFEYDEFAEVLNPINMSAKSQSSRYNNDKGMREEIEKSYKTAITDSGKIKFQSMTQIYIDVYDVKSVERQESVLDLNTMKLEGTLTRDTDKIEKLKRRMNVSGDCKYVKPDSTKVTQNWKNMSGF